MTGRTPFLMYHEVLAAGRSPARPGAGYARYVITDGLLREHLVAIREAGARAVSVGDAVEDPTDSALVGMTFDDGCESDLVVAAPILLGSGFGATFYVTVGHLGSAGFLTELQLRELADLGFEIGSHSMTHAYLTDLEPDKLHWELAESRDRLEQITGVPVRHLSCPGGRWNPDVARMAEDAGYDTVTTSRPVANGRNSDLRQLGRLAVMADTPARQIRRIAAGGDMEAFRWKAAFLGGVRTVLGNRLYDRARSFILDRAGG